MEFRYNFDRGACIEYHGAINDPPAQVEFIDNDTNIPMYSTSLTPGTWAKPSAAHFIKWRLKVSIDGEIKFDYTLDLTNKRVIIVYPYTTLGDFIMWLPIFEEFRLKHKCKLAVHCSRNNYIDIVGKSYPEIWFTKDYSSLYNEGVYAIYEPSLQYSDSNFWDGLYPKDNSFQKPIFKFFGMGHRPLFPKVDSDEISSPIEGKYVCITEHNQTGSPWRCWCHPNGYSTVAKFLINKGYKVVPISNEPTNLSDIEGVIDMTGKPLREMVRLIKHADLLIGGSTAPTWVGMALEVPTILICTNNIPHPDWPQIHYVFNHTEGTCYGCDIMEPKTSETQCDRPLNPMPDCIMNISPEMVIDKIKEVLTIS